MAKKKATRVYPHTDPTLKPMHRYIAAIYGNRKIKFRYLANRQEVRNLKKSLASGSYVEIHKATHDFKEAWLVD